MKKILEMENFFFQKLMCRMGRVAKINFLELMCLQICGPVAGQLHWDSL